MTCAIKLHLNLTSRSLVCLKMSSSSLQDPWFERFFEHFCGNCSCHGGNWLVKIRGNKAKSFFLTLLLMLQIFMISAIINSFFFEDPKISTKMKFENQQNNLPSITVCNPRLFNTEKLENLGINRSSVLGAVLPASFEDVMDFMKLTMKHSDDIVQLHQQTNKSSLALMKSVVIDCEDFILDCDDFSQHSEVNSTCCERFFIKSPSYSANGACFTSKEGIFDRPKLTGQMDGPTFRLKLRISKSYSKGIGYRDLPEKYSVFGARIVFHLHDHGIIGSNKRGIALRNGTANRIGLYKYSMDNSSATEGKRNSNKRPLCISKNDIENQWIKTMGFPSWSKPNCEYIMMAARFPNCSGLLSSGFEFKLGQNKDVLEFNKTFFETLKVQDWTRPCELEDVISFYKNFTESRKDLFGPDSIFRYFNATGKLQNGKAT